MREFEKMSNWPTRLILASLTGTELRRLASETAAMHSESDTMFQLEFALARELTDLQKLLEQLSDEEISRIAGSVGAEPNEDRQANEAVLTEMLESALTWPEEDFSRVCRMRPAVRMAIFAILTRAGSVDSHLSDRQQQFLRAVGDELGLGMRLQWYAARNSVYASPILVASSLDIGDAALYLIWCLTRLVHCDSDCSAGEEALVLELADQLGVAAAVIELMTSWASARVVTGGGSPDDGHNYADLREAASPPPQVAQQALDAYDATVGKVLASAATSEAVQSAWEGVSKIGEGAVAFGMAGLGQAGSIAGKAKGLTKSLPFVFRASKIKPPDICDLGGDGDSVVIGVSGFLSEKSDFTSDWQALETLFPQSQRRSLRWASKSLIHLGNIIGSVGALIHQHVTFGPFAWPVAAYGALSAINNPWASARNRTEVAGAHLAELIRDRYWQDRPVTLVGFSLGARVIYHALRELSTTERCDYIDRVILLGGAVDAEMHEWDNLARSIEGPFVNGYCRSDKVLGYLYRAAEFQQPIGLGPIPSANVINIDLGQSTTGHLEYRENLEDVLFQVRDLLLEFEGLPSGPDS